MDEISILSSEIEDADSKREHFLQVDIIKATMIFLVLFDHTIPWLYKNYMGVALWERISIPVFLVILGFNAGHSFRQKGQDQLKELYSRSYFKRKFWRYVFPFLILYLLSTIIGLAINGFDLVALAQYQPRWDDTHLFIGILPFWGPGNWFLPVLFASILLLPLLYKGFSGKLVWRILTLIACFIVEIAIQLIFFFYVYLPSPLPSPFPTWETYYNYLHTYYWFATSPLFMLSAIGLGMWFSKNPNIFAKQNIFMWILFPLSLVYLIYYQFFDFQFPFIRGDYNLLVFPYSAILFLIVMKVLPKKSDNLFTKAISIIGKSTYHILLTQILYFAIVFSIYGDHYCASLIGINDSNLWICFLYLLINWGFCIHFGVLWWYAENKIRNYRKKLKEK
ncbi:MAG: acyltransferase family protein [Promethearchaeota archaeon]|jgi:peptidoglycan/LPS O-acetylase OafA/YrhL